MVSTFLFGESKFNIYVYQFEFIPSLDSIIRYANNFTSFSSFDTDYGIQSFYVAAATIPLY